MKALLIQDCSKYFFFFKQIEHRIKFLWEKTQTEHKHSFWSINKEISKKQHSPRTRTAQREPAASCHTCTISLKARGTQEPVPCSPRRNYCMVGAIPSRVEAHTVLLTPCQDHGVTGSREPCWTSLLPPVVRNSVTHLPSDAKQRKLDLLPQPFRESLF